MQPCKLVHAVSPLVVAFCKAQTLCAYILT